MDTWFAALHKPQLGGISLIQEFTLVTSSNFNSMITEIKKYSQGMGLSGYLKWLKEMMIED